MRFKVSFYFRNLYFYSFKAALVLHIEAKQKIFGCYPQFKIPLKTKQIDIAIYMKNHELLSLYLPRQSKAILVRFDIK